MKKYSFLIPLLLFPLLWWLSGCQASAEKNHDGNDTIPPHEIRGDCKRADSIGTIDAYNLVIAKYKASAPALIEEMIAKRNALDTAKTDSLFKVKQLKYKNARQAYETSEDKVRKMLEDKKIDYATLEIYMRVIKKEQIIEMWAKDRKDNHSFVHIKNYKLCVEKNYDKKRGVDLLIPESFYYIKHFYPFDPYCLRLEVNFPNESDEKRGRTGGDIAVHGGCFSTYCTPLTDEDIREIYIMALEARTKGQQKVPVHNFPFRLDSPDLEKYSKNPEYQKPYNKGIKRHELWQNMKKQYIFFEENRLLLPFTTDKKGRYIYGEL